MIAYEIEGVAISDTKSDQVTADPIYEQLKSAITAGELAPGEPHRQDAIARNHGVSKIPVREKLLRLELDGLVLFRKNKGVIVRELSVQEVAIPHMVSADYAAARKLLDEYS